MDNNTNLELEILITLSQNKKVASSQFIELFEDKWNRYDAKFQELVPDGLFEEVTEAGVTVYELTEKGKHRITDLIDQREAELLRLVPVKKKKALPSRGRKSVLFLFSALSQFRIHAQKAATGRQVEISR